MLSIAAVAIGVSSVVLINSIGTTACAEVQTELGQLGGNLIFVYAEEGSRGLDPLLSDTLEKTVDGVTEAVPLNLSVGSYSMSTASGKAAFIASGEAIEKIVPLKMLYGRLPTEADVRDSKRIAVIDNQLAMRAYGRENVIGKQIQLKSEGRSESFTIIGVIQSLTGELNSVLGYEIPSLIITPYSAFGHGKRDTVRYLMIAGDGSDTIDDLILNEIEKYNGLNSVKIENIGAYVAQVQNILGVVSVFISIIGGIALIIAGCSVMSSMFSSVRSRRREIGIYMALGASSGTITALYLTESVILCMLGNTLGLCLYLMICLAGRIGGLVLPINVGVMLGMSAAALVIGLACGIMPARRAAKMEPMQILQE